MARADVLGRPPLDRHGLSRPAIGCWTAARRLGIENHPPEPLVLGRHLMALGQEPGPAFGEILARCYEAQLEGKFTTVEAGVRYAEKLLGNR